MKTTQVDEEGNVRCPRCGSKSFTSKRTGVGKLIGIATVGVGVLAVPKRLHCNGCGANLMTGSGTQEPFQGPWTKDNPHPTSIRARMNRRAEKKAARHE